MPRRTNPNQPRISYIDTKWKRAYNKRVIEIEQGVFTPLAFGTNGAMGKECIAFHKMLASKLAEKYNRPQRQWHI